MRKTGPALCLGALLAAAAASANIPPSPYGAAAPRLDVERELGRIAGQEAQPQPAPGAGAPMTAEGLMAMAVADLDALYAAARPGALPDGAARGVASTNPGTGWGGFTQGFFAGLWQGKTFDRAKGELVNRTAAGDTATAKVYVGASRVDGKPSIILDYTKSSNLLARGVRDEIREVRPGLYLGIAYIKFPPLVGGYKKWLYFALDFAPRPQPAPAAPGAEPAPQAP